MSIGIHASAYLDLTDLLLCADEALYAAKTQGRNRYRVLDGSLCVRLTTRCAIERDLPQAMARGELDVFFQPVFREGGGVARLDSVEALLRWEHSTYGPIAPPDRDPAGRRLNPNSVIARAMSRPRPIIRTS